MIKAEQACQINVINWMRHTYPLEESNTFHFANERKCSIQTGRLLKRMGVKSGVADIFISLPRHEKHGLWVELKVDDNYPTKEQKAFMERQFKNGYAVACCWELDAVKKVISNYLSDCCDSSYFDSIVHEKMV